MSLNESLMTTWRLIEVKATSKVKAIHFNDVAIQTAVLLGCGLPDCRVMSHAPQHAVCIFKGGELNLDQLFTIADLTETVRERQEPGSRAVTVDASVAWNMPKPP